MGSTQFQVTMRPLQLRKARIGRKRSSAPMPPPHQKGRGQSKEEVTQIKCRLHQASLQPGERERLMNCRIKMSFRLLTTLHNANREVTSRNGAMNPFGKTTKSDGPARRLSDGSLDTSIEPRSRDGIMGSLYGEGTLSGGGRKCGLAIYATAGCPGSKRRKDELAGQVPQTRLPWRRGLCRPVPVMERMPPERGSNSVAP